MATRNEWNSYKMFEGLNIWGTPAFAGAAVDALDLSGLVPGTELDGSLIKAGTQASQIEFSTAEQFGMKWYLKSNVTSGMFTGLKLRAEQAGIGGDITGIELSAIVTALTPGSGNVYGLKCYAMANAGGFVASSKDLIGAWIEAGAEAGSTINGDVWGLWVRDACQVAVAGSHYIVHISADGATIPTAAIAFRQNTEFVFYFYQIGSPAVVNSIADITGGANQGWIKVYVDGATRYIQLYA